MRKSKVAGVNPSCGIADVSGAAEEKWGTCRLSLSLPIEIEMPKTSSVILLFVL